MNDTSGAWKGIWVQQPEGSSTYSGRWIIAGQPIVTAVLVVSAQGERVTFQRTDDPNVFQVTDCFYDGTYGADGTNASGTVTCNSGVGGLGPFSWNSNISCTDPRPSFEINTDRPGNDYRNFELPVDDPAQCWAQCELEDQCVAWTFVHPGVQGINARCWLKNPVPAQVPNAVFAISGVKGVSQAQPSAPVPVAAPVSSPTSEGVQWNFSPQANRGQNGQRFTYSCPPINAVPEFAGWGTDIYTDDSPLCAAAVHAGVLTAAGGSVTVEIRPGQASYVGSSRRGTRTDDFGQWFGSYVFIS